MTAAATALAGDVVRLPDEEVRQLCDMIEVNERERNDAVKEQGHTCWDPRLGSVVQNLLQSKSKVIAKHLVARQATYKKMRVFIYEHTHQFENPWRSISTV